jgi:IS30 family transposase
MGELSISHEIISRYIWDDWYHDGELYKYLRGSRKRCRKRYGSYDSRGRLAGKRHITERPPEAEDRTEVGHLEIDTLMGKANKDCVLTIVDRKTGYTMIGELKNRTQRETARKTMCLLRRYPGKIKTITADNGTEFHSYKTVEERMGVKYYFATPYHSWERGTRENTNGLTRQYLPRRTSLADVTQYRCDAIAKKLNNRHRKRLRYQTPDELFS